MKGMVDDSLRRFLLIAEGRKKTVEQLEQQLRQLAMDLPEMTGMDGVELRHYFARLAGVVSAATVNARIWAARRYFAWAVKEKLIDENPMDVVKSVRIEHDGGIKRLTNRETEYVLMAARHDTRDVAILRFMLDTAARVSEVTQVTREEFKRALYEGRIVLHGKGGRDEYVAFSNPKTIKAIKAYLKTRKDNCPFLFASRLGKAVTPRGIQHLVKKHMMQANARYRGKCRIDESLMHPHTLRHTALDEFYRLSKDPVATREFGRHRSFSSTLVYVNSPDYGEQSEIMSRAQWNV